MLRCEARAFPVGTAYGYMTSRPFFTPRKTRMRINLDHVASGRFVLRRVESDSVKSATKAKDKLHKACERVSEICEWTLHRQEQNRMQGESLKPLSIGRNKTECTWQGDSLKPLSKLCIGRNKTECAWQAWESHETVIDSGQHKYNHMQCCTKGLALQCLSLYILHRASVCIHSRMTANRNFVTVNL